MKRHLSALVLGVLTLGLLGSCTQYIEDFETRIDEIETTDISSIEQQIAAINSSIADLETIRQNIQSLIAADAATGESLAKLREADAALGVRIDELRTYVENTLKAYATTTWLEATFATKQQHEWTCDTIAKIDARIGAVDTRLSQLISDIQPSLESWVSTKLSDYYTAAQMDAKLEELQTLLKGKSGVSAGDVDSAKIASLGKSIAEMMAEVDTAKAAIRTEYAAVIKSAIEQSEGRLTKALSDSIAKVNAKLASFPGRLSALEVSVAALAGRLDALEQMIQSVSVVSSAQGVKVMDGILSADLVVLPASAVASLGADSIKVLVNTVKTKAVGGTEVALSGISKDVSKGIVSVKADLSSFLPVESGKALAVAFVVNSGLSCYTTDYVGVSVGEKPLSLPGKFSVSATEKVNFSRGNLFWDGDSFEMEKTQYAIAGYAADHIGSFYWNASASDAYAQSYSAIGAAANDTFFTNASDFTVAGQTGFRTMSAQEWEYILSGRDNAANLFADDVTVCGVEHCLVIAPDGYVFDKSKASYNEFEWDEAEAAGLVCLPPAGYRVDAEVGDAGVAGYYWTASSSGDSSASNLGFKKSDN